METPTTLPPDCPTCDGYAFAGHCCPEEGSNYVTNEDLDWEITEAMIRYGGSFVHGLGRLFRMADATNKAKLQTAFPEYWIKYRDIAAVRKSEDGPS